MKNDELIRKWFLRASIILYFVSLTQVGYIDDSNGDGSELRGIFLLLIGWLNVFSGGTAIAWLANPILWYSWTKRDNLKYTIWSSFLTVLLGLLFLTGIVTNGRFCIGGADMPSFSIDTKIINYGLGYYLWLSSILTWFIGNLYSIENTNRNE